MYGGRRISTIGVAVLAVLSLAAPVALASHNTQQGIVGKFEIDGNFSFDGITVGGVTATRDWANVGGVIRVTDLADSASDDVFTQGSKENEPDGWVFTQSKPSGKTDLTRAYLATVISPQETMLWLGFERRDISGNGSANVNFEINKKTTTVVNGQGTTIPERSDGDWLVVYDYPGGTNPVSITVLEWDGIPDVPATPRNEEALFGEWKPATPAPEVAFGDVNGTQITRPLASPFGGGTVDARRFGEVGIDINAAFGPGAVGCPGFGSFYAKSRASGNSFNSSLEDITPRGLIDLSNCGEVRVLKVDEDGAALNGATFGLFGDTNGNGQLDQGEPQVATCVTGEEGVAGRCAFEDVTPGKYTVKELAAPNGYVVDPTVSAVTLGFKQTVTVQHIYTDIKIRYRLTLTPENDSNLVDTDHVINALLERSLDAGSTWQALPEETVGFSLSGPGSISNITPAGPAQNTCTTAGDGTCAVTITSSDPGATTLTASFQKMTATTPATAGAEANKTWANYRVTVTPLTDENVVGNPHTFDVVIERDAGSGWEPVAGATPDVSLDGAGSITDNTCADPGTNAQGQCSVTITSDEPGSSTLSVSYLGVEGDTSSSFEASAEKTWVDFDIEVTPDGDTNPVRLSSDDTEPVLHTFEVKIRRTENGVDFIPVEGAMPFLILEGVGEIVSETCSDPGTDADGVCTVTITSPEPGTSTLTAVYHASIGGSSGVYQDDADKFWEDNDLTIDPPSAFNKVGDVHRFTLTLTRDTGDGPSGYEGQEVSLTLDAGDTDAEIVAINDDPHSGVSGTCITTGDGTCTIDINSTLPGPTTLTAEWAGLVGTTNVTRTASGDKTYLNVGITKAACPSDTSPVGGIVDYDVWVSSAGATLTGAVVTDDLPPEVSFVSASDLNGVAPSTPAEGESNGTITWDLGGLPAGDYHATVRVIVNEVPEGTTFTNEVTFVADEFADDPETASYDLTVADGASSDARSFGVSADLLGTQVVAPTPDSDLGAGEGPSIPDPFGGATPLVRTIMVDEAEDATATSRSASSIATAVGVNVNAPGLNVTAASVVASTASEAGIAGAGSSRAGSRVQDLVVNGTRHGDITEPTTIIVRNPLGGVIGEVHVLREAATGAAAGEAQPNSNASFASGLTVDGLVVIVHPTPLSGGNDTAVIVVSHAESAAGFASGLGCRAAPSVGGDAFALDVAGLTPDAGEARIAQVLLPGAGGADAASLADVVLPVGTSSSAATSTQGSTSIDPDSATADSIARIEGLSLLGGMITAGAIEATASADLDGAMGGTTIADLVIDGTNVCSALGLGATCQPEPNTVLVLDDGNVIVKLNEQLPLTNGIRVNAVHIWVIGEGNPLGLPAGAQIIISSASASAHPSA